MSDRNYTVMHLHSDLSSGVTNIDSVTKYDEYIDYAASLGMKAIGFSEHGSVFQWLKKKNHIEELGMKYIHAEEFYLTENLFDKEGKKIRDNYHCLLIALNEDGFHELNTLSSLAFEDDHKYYVPRITFDELFATSDNILVTSSCIGGALYSGTDSAKEKFLNFLIKNKHRCYLEIQHHCDSKQGEYNKYLYELSKKYDIPLVAMTDTHALNEEHLKGRAILQKAKNIHFSSEDGWDLTFKTYDELVEAYKKQNALPMDVVLEAIENTNRIADKVQPFEITKEYKYPHLWKDPEKLFKQKINEGAKRRGIFKKQNYKEYKDRVQYELKAYEHNEAIDFMLLMEDIVDWCSQHDIKVGYGRGSVNGSVIAYLLGITEMDSIKHGLNFDRFMNIERVSLSDIDTDFPPSRREEVKDYIIGKDGLYCCDIITFNTIALKGAIRDVGRALEIDLDTVGKICNAVDDSEDEMRKQYPELFEYVDIVNGTIVSVGSHPCFPAGELVMTSDGYKEIQDVQVGDVVVTHTGNLKKVCDVMVNKSDDIYKIKSSTVDIEATGNHPFYVMERKNKRLRKYSQGIDTAVTYFEEPRWKNVSELKKGDMLGIPINQNSIIPNHPELNLNFYDNNLWWLIGRYLGDGWITDLNRGDSYLVVCCNKLGNERGEIVRRLVKAKYDYRIEEKDTCYRIYIQDKDLMNYIRNFGKYADGKYIYYEVFNLPREQLRHFVNGYISADGHYEKSNNEFGYTTISKKLALGMALCISKVYMMPVKISEVEEHDEFVVRKEYHCKKKYKAYFHLDQRESDLNFYENGYVWMYCRGVEKLDKCIDTYNLSVYDDNSYTISNVAVHNCGMVVAPHDVRPMFGTFRTSTSKYPISQINMKEIDSLNYVKLDLLNLDTIELINETCKLAGIERLTPDNVDINDVNVWNSIRDDTTQIFQWEGTTGDRYIKKLLSDENIEKFKEVDENVDRMTLLSIGNSAIRPAGASYRDDLANGIVRKSGSEAIDDFLKPTFGYLVFQCQIIEFLHQYCGFTMGEADIVRRHFAKKTGTDKDIPIIKDGGYMTKGGHYIKGFIATMKEKYNMPKKEAEDAIVAFLQVIIDASRYLFSLNHSQPYSYEGYISGYLRYYYPTEFITTALNINKDKEEKTIAITNYANKRGIKISPIKFRYSKADYSCDAKSKTVYKGMQSIKFMNEKSANELYELGKNNYDSFIDLLIDIKNTSVDSRQIELLTKLDFFSEFGEPNALLKQTEQFNKIYGKKQFKKDKLKDLELSEDIVRKYATKETEKMFTGVDSLELLKEIVQNYKYQKTTVIDKLKYEQECLGYVTVHDKSVSNKLFLVTKLDIKRSIVNVDIYSVNSGKTHHVRQWRRSYDGNPYSEGDMLYVYKIDKKHKRVPSGEYDANGKQIWVEDPNELEYWLSSYTVNGEYIND